MCIQEEICVMNGTGDVRDLFGDQQPVTIVEQAVNAAQQESGQMVLQVQQIITEEFLNAFPVGLVIIHHQLIAIDPTHIR